MVRGERPGRRDGDTQPRRVQNEARGGHDDHYAAAAIAECARRESGDVGTVVTEGSDVHNGGLRREAAACAVQLQ